VLEWAQQQGMVKLGRVAIDSTRIAANASKDRVDSEQALRDTRARLRRQVRAWQKAADRDDQEPGGLEVAIGELNKALDEMPRRLERLKKSGLKKLSRTDEDARFLRQRGDKFVLGYSAEIAVSDDHLIVAQRVTQNVTDNGSLAPMLDQTEQRCGAPPGAALADSGFFSIDNLNQMEQRNIDAYVPDSNMARALNLGGAAAPGPAPRPIAACGPSCEVRPAGRLRAAQGGRRTGLRSPQTTTWNETISHPWIENVNNEFTLATLAFNITRLHVMRAA
jgi:hypothetical protein